MSLTEQSRRPVSDQVQVIDEEGRVRPGVDEPDLDEATLVGMYEQLRFARRFDERAVSLQRQGRIATYAPMRGQEAAQVGSAMALDGDDWLYPTYRDHAAKMIHGMSVTRVLLAMRGHGDGYAIEEGVNVMPEYIPIATQIPQATGAAWSAKLRGDDSAVLCYLGDGATSEGDFHEGLNFAGVYDVPVVFFCNNNQWAISVPRDRQTASETIAQKAHAYGIDELRVDGMDPLAVYQATRAAVEKARGPGSGGSGGPGGSTGMAPGDGRSRPTLIEAEQYRFGAHSTADDPSVYRDDVPDEWLARDPVPRYEQYLRRNGLLDDERVDAIEERIEAQLREAIHEAEQLEDDPRELFEHVYDEVPDRLADQLAEVERLREKYGDRYGGGQR